MSANEQTLEQAIATLSAVAERTVYEWREQIEAMQAALRAARFYVNAFQPTHEQEDLDREGMLQEIDQLAPPPPETTIVYCGVDGCCRAPGHEGDHDDIPF